MSPLNPFLEECGDDVVPSKAAFGYLKVLSVASSQLD